MKILDCRIDERGSSLTPEQIVDVLLADRSITVHQHYFVFDDADDIVWYQSHAFARADRGRSRLCADATGDWDAIRRLRKVHLKLNAVAAA
jgi:hypothetical protein